MKTILQLHKERNPGRTKEQRADIRKQMRSLKKLGQTFEHLAVDPETYQIYLNVKHS